VALRTAIVGAGLMGGWHARYAARAGARIAAVVDPRTEAAVALARRFVGASVFADLGQCLRACPVDVVHVCAGRESQAALASAALAAGHHVLVEKPAATSAAEARRLAELADRYGRVLCPVHQFPFQPGVVGLRQGLARLGDVVRVTHVLASAGGDGLSEARRRTLLLDLLPHPLSLFRALLGAAGLDGGAGWSVLAKTHDDLEISGVRNGTRLTAVLSLRARPPRNELIVLGTKATARADLFHGFATVEEGGESRAAKILAPFRRGAGLLRAATTNLFRRSAGWEPAYPGLLTLIRAFYASVREGAAPPVSRDELVEIAATLERIGD
jgi:predicted dehydrogenase